MKTSNITKSALALALGLCASGALAVSQDAAREDFQGDAFANGVNTVATNNLTWADTDQYSYVDSGKLVVDATTNAPTSATLAIDAATSVNGAINAAGRTASFEAKVSFTPATDTPDIGGSDLRFALYAKAGSGSTNLVVYTGSETVTATEIAANTETTVKVDFTEANKFQVYIGGNLVAGGPFAFANNGSISKVEFAGNGEVDDLVFSYDLVDTTISWPTTLSVASYVIGDVTNSLTVSDGTATIATEPGVAITFIGDTGYRTVTASSTAGTAISVAAADVEGVKKYFPQTATAGQDGSVANPYEIDSVNALVALKDAVANVAAARSLCYVQTANIDFTGEAAFAGIGVYADAALNHASAIPFTGTYDGQNFKISNITFTDRDYAGVFNRVDGGTIKNLTVENIDYIGTGSKYCASIVGYALNGATLENLVSAGTFGSQEKPGTHNMAGIVVRVSGGTTGDGTQILNCTNNATIYGGYTKLAGICAISQEKIAAENNPRMVFTGCANNGELVLNRSSDGITGLAGIVGYSDVNTVMTDCSNTGTITQQGTGYNTDCTGALIGMTYGHSITDGGNNSAPFDKKMIGNWAGATETGFQYATVADGVATTISGSPVAGGSYLLEGNATPSVSLALGETVTFDKSLGYTLTETGITTSAAGCEVVGSGTTTRTFSVAYIPVAVSYSAALDHLTAAWTVNGSSADKPDTLTNGDTYSVTFTAESGWAISAGAVNPVSGTAGTTAIVITVPAVEELPSYAAGDTTVIDGHTLTGDEASYLNDLVSNKGASAVETALASIDEDDFVAAALLNQDITETNAGSYEFKISKIRKSGTTVYVTISLTRKGTIIDAIKGTVTLYSCDEPDGDYDNAVSVDVSEAQLSAVSGTAATTTVEFTGVTDKFFKAVIE